MNKLMLRKENFIDAAWSFLFTFLLGILPTWAMVSTLRAYQQPIAMHLFTENGEFALYSASLMSAILYISVKDYLPLIYRKSLRNKKFPFVIKGAVPFQIGFMFMSLLIILASTILFMQIIIAKLPNVQGLSPDVDFLSGVSLLLFFIASLLSYFTTALDNAASTNYTDIDYINDVKVAENKLSSELDQLLEDK